MSNLTSLWNNFFIEPLRDTLWRTPSHKLHSEGKFALFHYNPADKRANGKAPVLIIYAFINRHYILDLLPQVSIIRSLLTNGLDIFATDWGTPSSYDQDLSLHHYINNYLDKSVDKIREHTNSDKVSIFGYCWGGDLAVMYAALYPEKVKNLITLATPGDFSLDDGLLSLWTKRMNVDSLADAFGNAPSIMLNAAFALRSPDYKSLVQKFLDLAQQNNLQFDYILNTTAPKSRERNGSTRTYGELIGTVFDIDITRIERTPDENEISFKWCDYSVQTIDNLINQVLQR